MPCRDPAPAIDEMVQPLALVLKISPYNLVDEENQPMGF